MTELSKFLLKPDTTTSSAHRCARIDCITLKNLDVAKLDYSLGRVTLLQAKYKQSEEYLKKALMIYTREKGADDVEVSHVLNRMGALYTGMNKIKEAEEYFLKALK